MKITNHMDGSSLEIPDIDPVALGRFIAARTQMATAAGRIAEEARKEFCTRSAINAGHLASQVASTCGIPIDQAVLIVLQVSNADVANTRMATEQFYSEHIDREIGKLNDPKKGLKTV
jgi:hypothetical protein